MVSLATQYPLYSPPDLMTEDAFNATTQKIKDALPQGVVGVGCGVGLAVWMENIYIPLTEKIVKAFDLSINPLDLPDPFSSLGLGSKILLAPFICILGPIMEEMMFRGTCQEVLKDTFNSFYVNLGFPDSAAQMAARVTSVFFSSVIFGLIHFTNAIMFWCNPILFLPQVVFATIVGLILGLAKEISGELYMPIGMHIGNNTLAWGMSILYNQ